MNPGNQIENRGLSRTVGTDQAADLAWEDVHGQIIHRHEPAEIFLHSLEAEYRFGLAVQISLSLPGLAVQSKHSPGEQA